MLRLLEASLMFPLPGKEGKRNVVGADLLFNSHINAVCIHLCVCMEVLYLSTLNLGKWMEFLMNTMKLMASTRAGSL